MTLVWFEGQHISLEECAQRGIALEVRQYHAEGCWSQWHSIDHARAMRKARVRVYGGWHLYEFRAVAQ